PWRPTAAPWRRPATTAPGSGTACPPRPADFTPPDATSPAALAANGSALALGQGVGLGMRAFRRPAPRAAGLTGWEPHPPEVVWRREYVKHLAFTPRGAVLAASVYAGARLEGVARNHPLIARPAHRGDLSPWCCSARTAS